jgi:GNAT superfamily N-acetyltransferase
MASLEIRKAGPDDIPVVLSLLRELAAYERMLDRVLIDEKLLAQHAFGEKACAEVVLGFLNGTAVSYAIFLPHFASFRGLPWLYLEDLYVQPHCRRQAVGRVMMSHLARIAIDRGWAGMAWGVLDWNEPAFGFYRKLGATNSNGHVPMELSGAALERLARDGQPSS